MLTEQVSILKPSRETATKFECGKGHSEELCIYDSVTKLDICYRCWMTIKYYNPIEVYRVGDSNAR